MKFIIQTIDYKQMAKVNKARSILHVGENLKEFEPQYGWQI